MMSFHSTTLATPSLDLAHSLARYLQTLVIFETRRVPKLPVALVARDPSVIRDAQGLDEQVSHDASYLCSAPLLQPLLHAGHMYPLAISPIRFVMT